MISLDLLSSNACKDVNFTKLLCYSVMTEKEATATLSMSKPQERKFKNRNQSQFSAERMMAESRLCEKRQTNKWTKRLITNCGGGCIPDRQRDGVTCPNLSPHPRDKVDRQTREDQPPKTQLSKRGFVRARSPASGRGGRKKPGISRMVRQLRHSPPQILTVRGKDEGEGDSE